MTAFYQAAGWTASPPPFCLGGTPGRCTGRPVWRTEERAGRFVHVGYWCRLHLPDHAQQEVTP